MAKKNKAWKKLQDGWQPSGLFICVGEKGWQGILSRIKLDHPYPITNGLWGSCTHAEHDSGMSAIIITLPQKFEWGGNIDVISVLAHEVSHMLDFIYNHMGAQPCTETRAYATESIMRECLQWLNKIGYIDISPR